MTILSLIFLSACRSTVVTDEERQLPTVDTDPVVEDDKKMDEEKMDEGVSTSFIAFTGTKGDAVSHEGKFTVFDFKMMPDETDPADYEKATVMVTVDIESLVTDSDGLTKHLLNPDFFEVSEYPTATFESTSITLDTEDTYTVQGDLTIKGATNAVEFDAEITDAFFYASFSIDRNDYGVGAAEGPKVVDAEVPMEIKIVFPKSE